MKIKCYTVEKLLRIGILPGPWDNEPDEVRWKYKGMLCYIMRGDKAHLNGNLTGYVQLQKDHPLVGNPNEDLGMFMVHGGVTFCGTIRKDKSWWVGFDTAHGGDMLIGFQGPSFSTGTYKDINYVKKETEKLAEQLLQKYNDTKK